MDPRLLQEVALSVAQAQPLPQTLHTIVANLQRAVEDAALVRLWLVRPGDLCERCPRRAQCADQSACLHLVASAGVDPAWNRIDGAFQRFPFGVYKVGRVFTEGPLLLRDLEDQSWFADPQWAAKARVRSFAGQPLVFRDKTEGVLAVFSRALLDREDLSWLRTFADHAAVAIANARALDEVASLKDRLQRECEYHREENQRAFGDLIGDSPALKSALSHVERVAPTDASVLLLGESGTGKELFARAIHRRSSRRDRALVKVNCAAVPEALFESEFFGHLQGAFSGATHDRVGRFEIADRGTLFLDEVGELPLAMQSKLLRVIQEGQFERLGEADTRTVDVRLICATNRNLETEVQAGRFREDLYYRLSTFPIRVPPLRERPEDIAPLAAYFLQRAASRFHRPRMSLLPEQLEALTRHRWPGNVRELQNVIERAAILAEDDRLPLEQALPQPLEAALSDESLMTDAQLKDLERVNTVRALERCGWQIAGPEGAAQLLGLRPTTLSSRIRALKIERP